MSQPIFAVLLSLISVARNAEIVEFLWQDLVEDDVGSVCSFDLCEDIGCSGHVTKDISLLQVTSLYQFKAYKGLRPKA